MMKFLLILIVIAVVAFMLGAKQRPAQSDERRNAPPTPPPPPAPPKAIVRCAQCGLHLPQDEALPGRGGMFCGAPHRLAYEAAQEAQEARGPRA